MSEIKQVPFSVIINIFRLISSKDIFENFFSKYLGERLLHRKSASMEKEHELVGLLKIECGQQFFSRVEQMFKDITISEEIQRNYN
jgi:cullin 3